MKRAGSRRRKAAFPIRAADVSDPVTRYRMRQNERLKMRLDSVDDVTRYHLKQAIRRNERAMRMDAEGDDTGWITVHPNGGKGVPVKIEDGEVTAGAGGALNGVELSEAESQPLSELKASSSGSSSSGSSTTSSSSGTSLSGSGSGIASGASINSRPSTQSLNELIKEASAKDQEMSGKDDRKLNTAAVLDAAPIGTKITMIDRRYRGEYDGMSSFYKIGEDKYAGGYGSEELTAERLLIYQDFAYSDEVPVVDYPSEDIMKSLSEIASGTSAGDVPTSEFSKLNIGVGKCATALGVTLLRLNGNTFLDVDNGNVMTMEEAEEAAAQGKNLFSGSTSTQSSSAAEPEPKPEIQDTSSLYVNGEYRQPMTRKELLSEYEFMIDRNGDIWDVGYYQCSNLSRGYGYTGYIEDLVSDGVTGIRADDIIEMEMEAAEPAYYGEKRPHIRRNELPETVLEESSFYSYEDALKHRRTLAVAAETGYDYTDAQEAVEAIMSFSSKGDFKIRKSQNMSEEEAAEAGLSKYYEQGEIIEQYIKDAQKWDNSETVYRGINITEDVYNNLMSQAENGEVMDQMGLSSWTTLDYVAEMFAHNHTRPGKKCVVFVCNSPTEKAVSVAHISKAEEDEDEVLYSKDARYVATGTYTAESEQYPGTMITYIELKEVD